MWYTFLIIISSGQRRFLFLYPAQLLTRSLLICLHGKNRGKERIVVCVCAECLSLRAHIQHKYCDLCVMLIHFSRVKVIFFDHADKDNAYGCRNYGKTDPSVSMWSMAKQICCYQWAPGNDLVKWDWGDVLHFHVKSYFGRKERFLFVVSVLIWDLFSLVLPVCSPKNRKILQSDLQL